MSKKRKRPPAPRIDAERHASRHGRRWLAAALLLAGSGVALALFAVGQRKRGHAGNGAPARVGARVDFPAPRVDESSPPVRFAEFVGAEQCAGCHRPQYQAWSRSVHGRAGGAPGRARVLAPFDGRPIRFKDAVVRPTIGAGRYVFLVEQTGRPPQRFSVDGVVGGGHMVGGGTQGFISRFPDGTVRFLPFDYIRKERVWFCNTGSRADRGWLPITPQLALADCGDWPPTRVLGDEPRFANCQGCHGSQVEVAFDASARRYETRYQTLAINCESCHGPGARHVALARKGHLAGSADIGMRALATLPKDASLDVCFQCHSLKDRVKAGHLAGLALPEYYSTALPFLGDTAFFADGRVRTFAYQEGHRYSACYRNGSMTCTSCHDPHSQQYRDVNGLPLPPGDRFNDAQCIGCHASKADSVEGHTHHAPASPGSRCVSCHMPYLQQPELGSALRYARSDHTIPIPRPAFDGALGIVNACAQCHADRGTAALQAEVDRLYGTLKPHPPLVSALARAEDDPASLLSPEPDHVIAQIAALSRFIERSLTPDMPSLPRATLERLQAMTGGADLDVRALALAALHFAQGESPGVRAFLVHAVERLGKDEDAIRRRWALVLGYLGDSYRRRGDLPRAIVAYRKALEILPNDARVLGNAGLAYSQAGDVATAVQHFNRSLELDPAQPLALVNLGNALAAKGDAAGAAAAYERAAELNPREPLAWLGLGNVRLRQGDVGRAVMLYEHTVAIDPSLSAAWFNLARAHVRARRGERALLALRRGLEFDPQSEEGRQLLQSLPQALATP